MGDQHDQWMKDALGVIVHAGETIAGDVASFVPGSGGQNQAKAPGKTKPEPHVTVISTPIVVHGKDDPPVVEIKKPINLKMRQDTDGEGYPACQRHRERRKR